MTVTIPIWMITVVAIGCLLCFTTMEDFSDGLHLPDWLAESIEGLFVVIALLAAFPFVVLFCIGQALRWMLKRIGLIAMRPNWRDLAELHYREALKREGRAVLLISAIFYGFQLNAADTITFTPFPQTGVTNFSIYYGPHPSRSVTNRVHIGTSTNWVVTNVAPATAAFVYATAWTNGVESYPSAELIYTNRQFAPTIEIRLNMKIAPTLDGVREAYTNILVARVPSTGNQQFFFMDALATLSQ